MRGSSSYIPLALVLLLAGPAGAQQLAWRVDGGQRSELFGDALARLADRNGDGIPELLVGAPGDSVWPSLAKARVVSGADLSLLLEVDSEAGGIVGDLFGSAVAGLGDFDGDGLEDLLIGAPDRQRVSLRSGADGHELMLYAMAFGDLGRSLAALGDLDGDGRADFAAGSPTLRATNGNRGVVRVLSSATGAELFHFEASQDDARVGGRDRIAAIGDLDFDGFGDLAVVDVELVGADSVPVVRVLSGAGGTELAALRFDTGDLVDDDVASIAAAGDFDGDGVPDLLVGSLADFGSGPSMGYVFSGATGAELLRVDGGDANASWITLRATQDQDSDGQQDLVVACDSGNTASAPSPGLHLLSGTDGSLLGEIATAGILSRFGAALVADFDVDGDGLADVVFGDATRLDADLMPSGAVESWSWGGAAPLATRPGDSRWGPLFETTQLVGDVDGDGYHDVASIHTSFSANQGVELRSGRDGARTAFVPLPSGAPLSLAAMPDLDGDGRDDWAAGYPGQVELRNGSTGALLQTLPGPITSFEFGRNVVAGIEPNGAVRVAVADPNSATAKFEAGEITLFDATSGALLFTVLGNSNREHLGTSLVALGDVTGDGVGEWAAGAPENATNGTDAGRVCIVNGATGVVMKVVRGAGTGERYGAALAVASDLDGDGRRDLLVGAPGTASGAGKVVLLSTATWAALATWNGAAAGDQFGSLLVAVGDVNLDGFIDWATRTAADLGVELRDGRMGALLARFEAMNGLPNPLGQLRGAAPWTTRSANGDKIPDLLVLDRDKATGFGAATLFALDDLLLQLEPPSAPPGATVTAATRGGPPLNPAALELVSFGGVFYGVMLAFATLDGAGAWSASDTIPPGLSGLTAELRSWTIGWNGKLMRSPVQELRFE